MAEKRSAQHARDKGGTPKRDATLRARADADPDSTATGREGEGTAAMDAEENAEPRNVSEENDEDEEDDEEEDDEDDDDETEDDDTHQAGSKKDREMHLTKPFVCVPIGATLELEGRASNAWVTNGLNARGVTIYFRRKVTAGRWRSMVWPVVERPSRRKRGKRRNHIRLLYTMIRYPHYAIITQSHNSHMSQATRNTRC